jgi:hypothetical protein
MRGVREPIVVGGIFPGGTGAVRLLQSVGGAADDDDEDAVALRALAGLPTVPRKLVPVANHTFTRDDVARVLPLARNIVETDRLREIRKQSFETDSKQRATSAPAAATTSSATSTTTASFRAFNPYVT